MSDQGTTNYGSKGKCFAYFVIFLALFLILWLFVIEGNFNALEPAL